MKASLGVFLRNRPDGWQKHHLLEEPVEPSAAVAWRRGCSDALLFRLGAMS